MILWTKVIVFSIPKGAIDTLNLLSLVFFRVPFHYETNHYFPFQAISPNEEMETINHATKNTTVTQFSVSNLNISLYECTNIIKLCAN